MKKNNKIFRTIFIVALVIISIVLVATLLNDSSNKPEELNYDGPEQSLLSKMRAGEIQSIYIKGDFVAYVLYTNSTIEKKNFPSKFDAIAKLPTRTAFNNDLNSIREIYEGSLPFSLEYVEPKSTNWTSIIFSVLSLGAMGLLIFFMFRQSSGGGKINSFGKSKARISTNISIRFSDVAGAEEEKEELAEIVEFLKTPKKFEALGARVPKGVLLVGPPGTGKTLFAKAVAGEAKVPFFSISGSDFVEMFVGTGAARVRDLFEQAKKNMPCIIFIDEIDAVGRQRGAGLGGGHDEREQTLNQLLVQMDGFDKNEGIIIMAATNRADILDPALLRPGRFDRQIYVHVPDVKGREAILKVHSRNKPLDSSVNFKIIARMTSGFSGADIENLLNEASILAARANRKVIIMEDVLEGINKVIAGPKKKSRVVTETDKRITAYHEAGHAIIAKIMPLCDEVQEISIIPRGNAAGYTLTRPENDDNHLSKNKLIQIITMMLGGRAAEEIVIHDISTGASNDIQRASNIARSMVTEWGMSEELGNMFLGSAHEVFVGRDYHSQSGYSEHIIARVDVEIKKILDNCYVKALEVVGTYKDVMNNMVKVLYAKETIYTDEVNMLFDGKSSEDVINSIDERLARNESLRRVLETPVVKKETAIKITAVDEKDKLSDDEMNELRDFLDKAINESNSANKPNLSDIFENVDSDKAIKPNDNESLDNKDDKTNK